MIAGRRPYALVVVGILASVGVVLGSGGPWGSFESTAWDMDYHRMAAMLAGVVAAVSLMSVLVTRTRVAQLWIAIGMGVVAWAVAIVTVVYVESTWELSDDRRDPTWCSPPGFDWGLWLTTISSIVLIVASSMVLVGSRKLRWLAAVCGLVSVAINVAAFLLVSVSVDCGIQ